MTKIYLAGSVPKGDKNIADYKNWRDDYKEVLQNLPEIQFLDPTELKDETDPLYVFGYNCNQVKTADIVIVSGEKKLGAGTAQEILIAKYLKKPVITMLPRNSHHRKTNLEFHGKVIEDWVHPFIDSTSDFIAESPKEALDWLEEHIKSPKKIKDISVVDEAIKYFIKKDSL